MPAPTSARQLLGMPDSRPDLFVSHATPDVAWATWIASTLEGAGFTVRLGV